MTITREVLLKGALQFNYLPGQKRSIEERPPVFSTKSMDEVVTQKIAQSPRRKCKGYAGYDYVEYKVAKFNNVPRYFGIPHPKAQVDLTYHIADNWTNLEAFYTSKSCIIKPHAHTDGRLFIMDYEQAQVKVRRGLEYSFGKNFLVRTDISSCFPSIYSHAIPWATVGQSIAKKNKSPEEWFNKLDELARWQKRNETQGLLVGPATSNLLAELILFKVDQSLEQLGYVFERYIDDYACYTETYAEAEEFIRVLSQELRKFNLHLSPNKTSIQQLPIKLGDSWTHELISSLPTEDDPRLSRLIGFLDLAVEIQLLHADFSVIKYAAKLIMSRATGKKRIGVIRYLLGLSTHYPVLIPVYSEFLFAIHADHGETFEHELTHVLTNRILNRCSDGICWILYYLNKMNITPSMEIAEDIIKTEDCFSITFLAEIPDFQKMALDFYETINNEDLYDLDRYWILIYQLYLNDLIENPYPAEETFDILKSNQVRFINLEETDK